MDENTGETIHICMATYLLHIPPGLRPEIRWRCWHCPWCRVEPSPPRWGFQCVRPPPFAFCSYFSFAINRNRKPQKRNHACRIRVFSSVHLIFIYFFFHVGVLKTREPTENLTVPVYSVSGPVERGPCRLNTITVTRITQQPC